MDKRPISLDIMPSVRELSERNQLSDIIKLLNAEIDATSGSPAAAQLLCNRGLCHQRLNLNRKALKVRGASGYFGGQWPTLDKVWHT